MSFKNTFATWEQYIIYLRKSRQDDPNETVEEVLAKHETMLQEFAVREFGARIPEENIYREVVSGESIEDREEIKKVLARIEDPNIKGVIVIEPSRLSRGDLMDCGRLINDLRYTKTVVATPYMTYDIENKMERKFFQDELLRGRDYLEYTKEILMRGRVAAVKRGCYIMQLPPYGYKKVKIGKDATLEIIPEEADVVRLVYNLYTNEGWTPGRIAKKLDEMGIKPIRSDYWPKATIRQILRNEHYAGKVVFNKAKTTTLIENGERVVKRLLQDPEDVIVAEGKHEAIIDVAMWEATQKLVARKPRERHTYELVNPLASILVCGCCGKAMFQHRYAKAEDRYECRNPRNCFKSVKMSEIFTAVQIALEESELPALKLKVENDDGNARKIQMAALSRLEKQLAEFEVQEEKQFELLETAVYTQEVFERRHGALVAKIKNCREEIAKTKQSMPEAVNYEERVLALEKAIEVFKDETATPAEKNKFLRAIVERIEYHGIPSDSLNRKRNKWNFNEFSLKVFLRV